MGIRKPRTPALFAAILAIGVAIPLAAWAAPKDDTPDRPHSQNMHLIGSSLKAGAVTGPPPAGPGTVPWDTRNTDLAFWGKTAIQGRYDGFRVIDISAPGNPREVAFHPCVSDQGDVGIWDNLVFRSVNSGTRTDECQTFLDRQTPGFEGIQIFDISDLNNIRHVASVPLDCGSHTHTVVPELSKNRVLIYNSTSGASNIPPSEFGNQCTSDHGRFDVVAVPRDDPASASVVGAGMLGTTDDGRPIRACHDIGVVLGDVNRAACAGRPHVVVFDISDPANPVKLFDFTSPTVTGFHSAAYTWDGSILALGWEPGGGTRPRCQETGAPLGGGEFQTEEMKSIFFHDAETGELLGTHVLPRPQSEFENCTIHNYNIAPHPTRNLLIHGSYQSGTALVDFTDPTNAYEVAWMDPDPLDPPSDTSPGGRSAFRGGDWSSYWYNGAIYESDARRGLYVWKVSAREVGGPFVKLDFLNPQTNHLSISDDRGSKGKGKAKGKK